MRRFLICCTTVNCFPLWQDAQHKFVFKGSTENGLSKCQLWFLCNFFITLARSASGAPHTQLIATCHVNISFCESFFSMAVSCPAIFPAVWLSLIGVLFPRYLQALPNVACITFLSSQYFSISCSRSLKDFVASHSDVLWYKYMMKTFMC